MLLPVAEVPVPVADVPEPYMREYCSMVSQRIGTLVCRVNGLPREVRCELSASKAWALVAGHLSPSAAAALRHLNAARPLHTYAANAHNCQGHALATQSTCV